MAGPFSRASDAHIPAGDDRRLARHSRRAARPVRAAPPRDERTLQASATVRRLRDLLLGLLVLGTVFITMQGAVGYFGFPSKSPMYWVVPGLAVLLVLVWYFRSSEDWTAPPDGDNGGKRGAPPDDLSRK